MRPISCLKRSEPSTQLSLVVASCFTVPYLFKEPRIHVAVTAIVCEAHGYHINKWKCQEMVPLDTSIYLYHGGNEISENDFLLLVAGHFYVYPLFGTVNLDTLQIVPYRLGSL